MKQRVEMKIKFGMLILVLFITKSSILAVPQRESVLSLLEGRHWELHDGPFRALGEGTDEVLREISDNSSLINYLRFRALTALALYENEETAEHLERHARSQDSAFARRGFSSLSRGFSESDPDRVRRTAEHLMRSSEAHLRIAAAREMRRIDTSTFKSFLNREPEEWVREAVKQ
tara:strand:+ start:1224 stop:1748 length:525 start_codon:yes stop_codon:yes gene_type:complete